MDGWRKGRKEERKKKGRKEVGRKGGRREERRKEGGKNEEGERGKWTLSKLKIHTRRHMVFEYKQSGRGINQNTGREAANVRNSYKAQLKEQATGVLSLRAKEVDDGQLLIIGVGYAVHHGDSTNTYAESALATGEPCFTPTRLAHSYSLQLEQ